MGSRNAEVAQLVEYLPSKQTVASSSLVFRSIKKRTFQRFFFIAKNFHNHDKNLTKELYDIINKYTLTLNDC